MALNNYQDADFTPDITPSDVQPNMGTYNSPQTFRFWCQKVLPLVYDNSLSYYELLCKVVDYLNKTMEDVNTAVEDVENLNSAFGSLENHVNASETALLQAYNDLQSYVNNYFNNLDVQQEINNKLDAMVEDGTLDALFEPYFDAYTLQTNLRISTLESRMNEFASLPDGSTAGDAELLDIRVGANGTTYASAGNAVRGNDTEIKNSIKAFTGDGIIEMISGYYINISGTTADVTSPSPQGTTPFRYGVVSCKEGDEFIVNARGGSSPRAYGFVSSDGRVLFKAAANATITNLKVIAPTDSAYIVVNDSSFSGISYNANTVSNRLSTLSTDVGMVFNTFKDRHKVDFVSGSITTGGTTGSSNTRIRSASLVPITRGMHWELVTPYEAKCAIYGSGDYIESANFIEYINENNAQWSSEIYVPDEYVGYKMAIVIRKIGSESSDISYDVDTITNYVFLHEPETIMTDNRMLDESSKVLDAFYFDWNYGHFITGSGAIGNLLSFAVTYPINVRTGNTIKNVSASADINSKPLTFMVSAFNNDTFVERNELVQNAVYKVKENCNNIRITYGYASSVSNRPDMSPSILDAYFGVEFSGMLQPFGLFTDGEHPAYVAFGASTTVAAVHHYTGEDITYSRYDYPDYVGRVLNLKTYNLGVGSTGMLERTSLVDNNIMDQIYKNTDILANAKLVSIVFGYGNDHYVGPAGQQIRFPIGEYDDYYPYDEEGYHPTGQLGTVQMVEKGATFMGCLNWCIKWINEHYPYAQLVIAFGSPSANQDRDITFTAQTPGVGVAPYKMSFADPYSTDPDHTSINYSIYLMEQEIKKLKEAMDIDIIDLFYDGSAFSWYSTYAKKPSNNAEYALFSTTGTVSEPTWNSHPNDEGYLYYARYLAGKIISMFKH